MKSKRKPSWVLKRAAMRVAEKYNLYGCTAIDCALYDTRKITHAQAALLKFEAMLYFRLVSPRNACDNIPWFGDVNATSVMPQKYIDHRVMALLLAAAIAEGEGR